jgi:Bacterial Ig-like domain (group 3)
MTPIPNASTNFPVALSATVSTTSSGVGPAGTMTFSSGGSTLGTAPVVGTPANLTASTGATGTATFNATFTTTGTKSITATYSGDLNYLPSGPSGAISINVVSSGTFNITATPVTVTAGSSGVSTVTVTPNGGFTGSVQVTCSGTGLPPGVSCNPNPLTIAITGTAPVTGALTVLVAAPSTTLSASRVSPEQQPLYADANSLPPTNSTGAHLSGWWTLSASSGLGSILLLLFPGLRGRKQLRAAMGLALLCVLSFTLGCGGGSSGGGGGGGGTQVATHTTLTVTNAKQSSTTNNFAFNVTVTSSGATPTGQVQLFDGSTALGLPVSLSNGAAAINTGLPTVGTHAVSAHYLGTAATLPSASGALNLTVTGSTSVPLTTTPSGSANINLTIQ